MCLGKPLSALLTGTGLVGEAYTLIRYRFAADAAVAMTVLNWARTVNLVNTERVDHNRAEALLARHNNLRLSYVDALLLAVAERHRLDELITLDGELSAVKLARPLAVTVI